ncbi:MAG: hypothetical protein OYH77_00175 [Pseudomonadota bacterium]|nr:hypothetical protein [Pseudomonadota bacterium]
MRVIVLFFLMAACGVNDQHAEVKAVRDQYRTLGLIQADDGMYEFRLCSAGLESYNAEAIQDSCINPLVDAEGNYRRFASIPTPENMVKLRIQNTVFTVLTAAGVGAVAYLTLRFGKGMKVAKEIVGKVRLAKVNKRLNDARKMNDDMLTQAFAKVERPVDSQLKELIRSDDLKGFVDDKELTQAIKIWQKRDADLMALVKQGDGESLEVNDGLQNFILTSAHGFKAVDEVYLKQLTMLDEVFDNRLYSYADDGQRYVFNKAGEPELLREGAGSDIDGNAFKTISELSDETDPKALSEIKDRINFQRDRQRRNLKEGVAEVRKSIVFNPADIDASRLRNRIKNRFQDNSARQIDDIDMVAKRIASAVDGEKTSRIYVSATNQARISTGVGAATVGSFYLVPQLQRLRPVHAAMVVNKRWSAVVGDFSSSAEEVADLRLTLDGLAQATDSHISTQVRIFGL